VHLGCLWPSERVVGKQNTLAKLQPKPTSMAPQEVSVVGEALLVGPSASLHLLQAIAIVFALYVLSCSRRGWFQACLLHEVARVCPSLVNSI
jgi:hypothetical protein